MRDVFSNKVTSWWQRIQNSIFESTARRYFFGIVFLLCVIVGSIAIHEKVWAVDIGIAQSTINTIINGIIWVYAQVLLFVAGLFIRLTMWALQFFIDLAAYNGYIDAPSVVVGWFMIRDVANMFFIVGLLVIAIGTILGREQYEWKKSLVKLVLAAIFINFSRLILGLAIDASHIVMITFLNAIQGAAGGNIIQMLKLDKILALSGNDSMLQRGDLREDVFTAAVAGFIFAFVSFLTVAAYTALMLVRMLVLWMLIILSPLAFVLQAIPQTESYAKEFWDELTKYIIVGPLMVFFLWLAFATMGSGDINTHVTINKSADANAPQLQLSRAQPAAGISDITKWENLSAFFIAVGFLFLGLERVGSIGVRGSSIVNSVSSAGIAAARKFSGLAAGQWAAQGVGKIADKAIDKFPVVGREAMGRYGRSIKAGAGYAWTQTNRWRDSKLDGLQSAVADKKGLTGSLSRFGVGALGIVGRSALYKETGVQKIEEMAKEAEKLHDGEITVKGPLVDRAKKKTLELKAQVSVVDDENKEAITKQQAEAYDRVATAESDPLRRQRFLIEKADLEKKRQKEVEEKYTNLTAPQFQYQADLLAQRMTEMRSSSNENGLKDAQERMAGLMSIAGKTNPAYLDMVIQAVLNRLGVNGGQRVAQHEIAGPDDVDRVKTELLTALTGEDQTVHVGAPADIEAVFDQVRDHLGSTVMKGLDDAFRTSAINGDVRYHGILQQGLDPRGTGQLQYGMRTNNNDVLQQQARVAADIFKNLSDKSLDQLLGNVHRNPPGVAGLVTTEFSPHQLQLLITALSPITRGTNLQGKVLNTLRELRRNNPAQFDRLRDELNTATAARPSNEQAGTLLDQKVTI